MISAAPGDKKTQPSCSFIGIDGVEDVFHAQPVMRTALDQVVQARQKRKAAVPKLDEDIIVTKEKGNNTLKNMFDLIKVEETLGSDSAPIPSEPIERTDGDVQEVTTPKGVKYFRPMHGAFSEGEKPRKTLAASILNKMVNLKTVAQTKWAKVNGELGTLSDKAPGDRLESAHKPYELLAKADPHSLANATSFEFLAGQKDGHYRNIAIDPKTGEVTVFDHDTAFVAGLVAVTGEHASEQRDMIMGATLPEKYTSQFVEALKALKPSAVKKKLENVLSEEEIEGVLFRRELMLQDIENRKATCMLAA